ASEPNATPRADVATSIANAANRNARADARARSPTRPPSTSAAVDRISNGRSHDRNDAGNPRMCLHRRDSALGRVGKHEALRRRGPRGDPAPPPRLPEATARDYAAPTPPDRDPPEEQTTVRVNLKPSLPMI